MHWWFLLSYWLFLYFRTLLTLRIYRLVYDLRSWKIFITHIDFYFKIILWGNYNSLFLRFRFLFFSWQKHLYLYLFFRGWLHTFPRLWCILFWNFFFNNFLLLYFFNWFFLFLFIFIYYLIFLCWLFFFPFFLEIFLHLIP